MSCFFFQAEDGIRDLVRSRGLGDVYKRQDPATGVAAGLTLSASGIPGGAAPLFAILPANNSPCLLYTSDAAAERSSVDLGGRRIIKKNNQTVTSEDTRPTQQETSRVYGQEINLK